MPVQMQKFSMDAVYSAPEELEEMKRFRGDIHIAGFIPMLVSARSQGDVTTVEEFEKIGKEVGISDVITGVSSRH